MSALDITTQIPASIVTLEQLHFWSGLALYDLNRTLKYKETYDPTYGITNVASATLGTAADGTERAILRTAIELDPTYKTDNSVKLWEKAKEFSNIGIPIGWSS